MKRFFSLFLAALALSLSLFSLSACNDFAGTYVSKSGVLTYTFTTNELTTEDAYTEYATVYSYTIEKSGSARYLVLTLKGYAYDGDNEAVAAYVTAQNKELAGKKQEPVRRFFSEQSDGSIKVGEIDFIKQK